MKFNIRSTFIGAGLLFAALPAQAITIDFEQLAPAVGASLISPASPYQEDGFTLITASGNDFAGWEDQGAGYTGSIALFTTVSNTATLTQNNGNEFTVNSIDFAWGSFGSPASDFTAQVIGANAVGDSFSETCDVTINLSLTTCLFASNFTVVSLSLVQNSDINTVYQFDNINITTVPVPAAAWLFGSGLLGLLGMARKKRTLA